MCFCCSLIHKQSSIRYIPFRQSFLPLPEECRIQRCYSLWYLCFLIQWHLNATVENILFFLPLSRHLSQRTCSAINKVKDEKKCLSPSFWGTEASVGSRPQQDHSFSSFFNESWDYGSFLLQPDFWPQSPPSHPSCPHLWFASFLIPRRFLFSSKRCPLCHILPQNAICVVSFRPLM